MKNRHKTGVLVINNNDRSGTVELIMEVERCWQECSVFLLDNECGPEELMVGEFKRFRVPIIYARSMERMSWSSGINLLMKRAVAAKCGWMVIILGSLGGQKEALGCLLSGKMRGGGSAKIRVAGWKKQGNEDGVVKVYWRVNRAINWWLVRRAGRGDNSEWVKLDRINGVSLDTRLVKKVGWLDERLYLGREVDDWLMRMVKEGETVISVAEIGGGERSQQRLLALDWYFTGRNWLLSGYKVTDGWLRMVSMMVIVLLGGIIMGGVLMMKGKRRAMVMLWSGLWDGIKLAGRVDGFMYPSST